MKKTGIPSRSAFDAHETADEVVAFAQAHKFAFTRDQLERWHRRGLVKRPQQISLGRIGTESRYPKGTGELVVAALRRDPHPANLTVLAWELWLAGHDVPIETVRMFVTNIARLHDRLVTVMRAYGFAQSILPGPAQRLIQRLALRRLRVAGVPGIAERLGSADRIETVLRTITQVATGAYDASYQVAINDRPMDDGRAIPSTDSDGLLVERALGIERARIDRLAGSEPWLRDDPTDALVGLTKAIGGSWLPQVLGASDANLAQARDEARELLDLFVGFGDFARAHFGLEAFGFPAIAEALRSSTPVQRSGLVILLLRARRDDELYAKVVQLRDMAVRWRSEYVPQIDAVAALRRDVPAMRDLLAPERIGAAMRDQALLDAYQAELRTVAEANRARIESVLSTLGPEPVAT